MRLPACALMTQIVGDPAVGKNLATGRCKGYLILLEGFAWGRREMQQWFILAALVATSASITDPQSNAMATGQPVSQSAVWSEVDSAVQSLRREVVQRSRNTNIVTAAVQQLDRALAAICTSQRDTSEATAAAPSGPVTGSNHRPDQSERALRERLTEQTHRPAGPGTSPRPHGGPAQRGVEDPCVEALSAAAAVRAAVDRGDASGEQALTRLEAILGSLRQARP